MKKVVLYFIGIIGAMLLLFTACEDILSPEERAEKAATEACECLKKKSQSKCEDELNSKYGQYTNNEDFIKAFNKAQTCDIYIYKKK